MCDGIGLAPGWSSVAHKHFLGTTLCCILHIFCSLFQIPDWIKIGDLTSKTCHLFVNLQSKGLKGGGIILILPEVYATI